MGIPESRIGSDSGFNLGRSSEILRDEIQFSRFVGRLRKRFSTLFHDMLKTQLILKNVVTPEDWEMMSDHIQYDYLYDNHFAELKETELMNERMNILGQVEPYIGKYYSTDYVRRNILRQTDQEIFEEDQKMALERELGIIEPQEPEIDPATGRPMDFVKKVGSDLVKKTQKQNTKDLEIGLGKNGTDPEVKNSKSTEAPEIKTNKGEKL